MRNSRDFSLKVLDKRASLPVQATPLAAGLDLRAILDEPLCLLPGEAKLISTGIAIDLGESYAAMMARVKELETSMRQPYPKQAELDAMQPPPPPPRGARGRAAQAAQPAGKAAGTKTANAQQAGGKTGGKTGKLR